MEGLLRANPFQEKGASIPMGVFSVNWAVVRCNKKPGPHVHMAAGLLPALADASALVALFYQWLTTIR
jgi:hypothetical protein